MKELISVGVFIDGGYYAKINEGLRDTLKMRLKLDRLLEYIRGIVAGDCDVEMSQCHVTEAHYFRGRYRASEENRKNILLRERAFEDTLIENDVIFHYKHLREMNNGGTTTVVEKGVDVWYALETYELAQFRDFDYVVLISGDADHEMLAKKLKALKVNVVLLTWKLGPQSSTSPKLKEEVCMHVELGQKCAEDSTLLNRLCSPIK